MTFEGIIAKFPKSGQELELFEPRYIVVDSIRYAILTGNENNDHRCFWCGEELKGKLRRYCYGHMTEYYNHFNWNYASFEAKKRANYCCENCGRAEGTRNIGMNYLITDIEVHHIIPLVGERFFSVYNLLWNLIVLCYNCHREVHAIMHLKPSSQSVMRL